MGSAPAPEGMRHTESLNRRTAVRRLVRQGKTMKYDLWDVAAGKHLGRFDSEAEALGLVHALLAANGNDYAEHLVLGSAEGRRGERKVTGAALIARVAAMDERLEAAEHRRPAFYGSHLADPATKAALDERAIEQAVSKAWSPSRALGTSGHRADVPAPPNPIHGQQRDSTVGRRRTQPPKKG
jgi:hypothetical protein